jgi:hypothetical protein
MQNTKFQTYRPACRECKMLADCGQARLPAGLHFTLQRQVGRPACRECTRLAHCGQARLQRV